MGARDPPATALACILEAGTDAGGAALWEVHANLQDPRVSSWNARREPNHLAARQGPGCSCRGLRTRAELRESPVVLEKSAPSLFPIAFQNFSTSCPLHVSF